LSNESFIPNLILDVKGLSCPLPAKKTKEAIEKICRDQILEVISTDPESKIDIPALVFKMGHELLDVIDDWMTIRFYIRKIK
jgi:tRNA 2-thiouridine synthesizing protein A